MKYFFLLYIDFFTVFYQFFWTFFTFFTFNLCILTILIRISKKNFHLFCARFSFFIVFLKKIFIF